MPTQIRQLFREVARTHGIRVEDLDFSEPGSYFYHANGIRFHYLDWGGGGYPVVFLHGNLQSANTWDLIAVQMRERYHCFGLDQRNFGETDRVKDSGAPGGNRPAQIEDAHAFVSDELRLKDYALVGMSMGGGVGMGYAVKYPQGLRALVIIDTTPSFGPPLTPAQMGAERPDFRFLNEFESIDHAVDLAMKANPGRPRVHMEYTMTNSLTQRGDGKWVWKRPRIETPPAPRRDPPTPEQVAEQKRLQDLQWEALKQIACPTMLVLGGKSERTTAESGVRFAATVKKSRVVTIPGASHNVQGDQPKALAGALTTFFEEVL